MGAPRVKLCTCSVLEWNQLMSWLCSHIYSWDKGPHTPYKHTAPLLNGVSVVVFISMGIIWASEISPKLWWNADLLFQGIELIRKTGFLFQLLLPPYPSPGPFLSGFMRNQMKSRSGDLVSEDVVQLMFRVALDFHSFVHIYKGTQDVPYWFFFFEILEGIFPHTF